MRWKEIMETATSGGTGAASIATAVGGLGAGFDPNGHKGIYEKPTKKKKKTTEEKAIVLRR